MTTRLQATFAIVLLAAATLVAFWPVQRFEYVFDDVHLFLTSSRLTRPSDLWAVLTEPFIPGTYYFRPLVLASFVAEFSAFGVDPGVSHRINLAIFVVNVVLVFLLALRYFQLTTSDDHRCFLASIAAGFYALHPALIEPVGWVSGRFDLLVTTWALATCLVALKRELDRLTIAVVSTGFFFAALCKETVMFLPLCVVLLRLQTASTHGGSLLLRMRNIERGDIVLFGALCIAGLAYLLLRFGSNPLKVANDWRINQALTDPLDRIAFVGQSLWLYLKLIFWPFQNLSVQYPFDAVGMSAVERGFGAALAIAALAAMGWFWHRPGPQSTALAVGFLFLLPVLNWIPLPLAGNLGHPRFLSLPLAFVLIGLVGVAWRAATSPSRFRRVATIGIVAVAMTWSALTLLNHRVMLSFWSNQLTLWGWSFQTHPNSVNSQYGYLSAAIQYRQFDLAKKVVDYVEASGPIPPNMDILIGLYHVRLGETQRGIQLIEQAVARYDRPHLQIQSLGLPLSEATVTSRSYVAFDLVLAYSTLAEAYNSSRQFRKALESSNVALFYQRDFPNAWLHKSFSLYGLNEWDEAQRSFQQALVHYGKHAGHEVMEMRRQFLEQLCSLTVPVADEKGVCAHWRESAGRQSEPAQPVRR